MSELQDKIQQLGGAFEEFKSANDARIAQIEESGKANHDTLQKLEKAEKALDELQGRIGDMEARRTGPTLDEVDQKSKKQVEHFKQWLATGDEKHEAAWRELQTKDISIGSANDGGVAVPEVIAQRIEQELVEISPMRSVVRVQSVGTSDYKELVDVRGTTSGWVGETAARPTTNTPGLQEVIPTMGELYAEPRATQVSLEDIFFDVEAWLTGSVTTEFAFREGVAVVSGTGANQPTGFLAGTPTAQADGVRAFGTLQYIPTGVAADFAADPNAGDTFIDTVYSLKAGYRQNASWMMSKLTLAAVRKFKDSDGQYLWQPAMAAGQPATLLGYPVVEAEAMPGVAADAFPVAFGDFQKGYLMVDRVGVSMLRDPYTEKPYVKFYTRKRVGGIVHMSEAIKLIRIAAS